MQSQNSIVQVRQVYGGRVFPRLFLSKPISRRPKQHIIRQVAESQPLATPQIPEILTQSEETDEQNLGDAKYQPYRAGQPESQQSQFYTNYAIYRKSAAMQISFIPPTWESTRTNRGAFVKREGTMCLQFSKSIGERVYDWKNKIVFTLSALELGQIMDMPQDDEIHSFFHDPNMQTSNRGFITKTLKIQQDSHKTGFFITVSQSEKGGSKAMVSVPVSKAEYNIIATLAKYAIPHILGFDRMYCTQ
eukprot:TRINITY_DN4468_c0_g1_i1.p2 TRINITY_DN4468_c0_g1~~TRINITY_DN4468_c0_g1_i1.p2  ORF type:complete len:247 (+),score=13.06 TRINITY_DN4468_c0_g1_i1:235-975(+)